MKRLLYFVFLVLLITNDVTAKRNNKSVADNKIVSLNDQQGEVNVVIIPAVKTSQFTQKTKVNYKLYIKNGIRENQEGTITFIVKDTANKEVTKKVYDISIPASKKLETLINIPHFDDGKFSIAFIVELNKVKSNFNFNYTFGIVKKTTSAKVEKQIKLDPPIDNDLEGEIKSKMKPENEDGIFIGKSPIVYNVSLENTYDITEIGTIAYTVKDAIEGTVYSEKVYDLKMSRRSSRSIQFKIATPPKPGIYNVDLIIHTNTYDDTTHHSFGYEIAQINNPYHKPDDFDAFWKDAMEELALVGPEYSVKEDPTQSTKEIAVYKVEMNSIENIRNSGWLTIPKTVIKGKKFPVVISYVGYQVMAHPILSGDFVQLSMNMRGTDLENMADINPEKQDLLTLNIQDPRKFVYRGIYMDCIRTLDFIFAKEEMGFDLSRIALVGGSQGAALALVVAGLQNTKVKTVIADNPIYCDFHVNLGMKKEIKTESFVITYINRYLEENKNMSEADILNTLSYFEVQNFIPKINCPVLFGVGLLDPLAPANTTIPAYNKLKPAVQKQSEIYTFPGLAHEVSMRHNTFKGLWIYEKLAE
ncbi:MAG: acetylxylan esterase [Bacteroidota bacterium]